MLWHVIAEYGQDGLPSELITEPLQATGNFGPSYAGLNLVHVPYRGAHPPSLI